MQRSRAALSYNNDHRQHNFPVVAYKPYLLKEDDERKIPAFLVKLWNIVEGQTYKDIVCWDESGLSFHIIDPYAFCSNVLPQYFKHKNLNSLVRQLNMYGFRKNTPIDRSGLTRAESDQDHLEFAHPFFRRDHPHLLMNIKRKAPGGKNSPTSNQHRVNQFHAIPMEISADGGGGQNSFDMKEILEELGTLRERQHHMEIRMEDLTKENEMLWNEMAHVRGTHLKQQQLVNKLIQFLVALVGPCGKQSTRLGKRLMSERSVNHTGESSSNAIGQLQSILPVNASEILDRLINDITSSDGTALSSSAGNLIFGRSPHKQGMKHHFDQFNHHCNIPTEFDSIDDLLMDNSVGNNNQQIQPYAGNGIKNLNEENVYDRSVSGYSVGPITTEAFEIYGRSAYEQGMKRQFDQYGHHSNIPSEINAVDDILMDNNLETNQQIQPYAGNGMKTLSEGRENVYDRSVSGYSAGPMTVEATQNYGHSAYEQGMKRQLVQYDHCNIPTEINAIDGLLIDNNVGNNRQIQPYTANGIKPVGEEREGEQLDRSVSSRCSDGPTIAEVIETEQLKNLNSFDLHEKLHLDDNEFDVWLEERNY